MYISDRHSLVHVRLWEYSMREEGVSRISELDVHERYACALHILVFNIRRRCSKTANLDRSGVTKLVIHIYSSDSSTNLLVIPIHTLMLNYTYMSNTHSLVHVRMWEYRMREKGVSRISELDIHERYAYARVALWLIILIYKGINFGLIKHAIWDSLVTNRHKLRTNQTYNRGFNRDNNANKRIMENYGEQSKGTQQVYY